MKLIELGLPKSELMHLIDEWVYNTRNKSMLIMKIEGFTYEEIAEKFNLSTQHTKEVICASQNLIIKHCK